MLEEDALNAVARRLLDRPPTERRTLFAVLDAMLRAIEAHANPTPIEIPVPRKIVRVRQSG
jgi:hypothetical protein